MLCWLSDVRIEWGHLACRLMEWKAARCVDDAARLTICYQEYY